MANRPVTVQLVSASRSVRGQNTSLATHARTRTNAQGQYEIPLVPNGDVDDLGSYYLIREWELGVRAVVVPPRTDPRVDSNGRVALSQIVVDGQTALPEPSNRPPLYLLRAERSAPNGIPALGPDGKVPASQLPPSSGGGVPPTRTLTAGPGLTGGGTLESDRSFAVAYGSTAGTAAQGNDPRLSDPRTPTAHTHPAGEVTGLAQVATTGQYAHLTGRPAIPATYADLSGTVPDSAIPAVAVTDYLGEVADQAAMLALTGQKGDWITRGDRGTNWQIIGSNPAELSSWRELSYPASPVQSVFGRTGAVTGSKADVGLDQVDNTADLDKPISDDTAAALATKADAAATATALATKADAAATTAALAGKASTATVDALAAEVSGKAADADLDALAATVTGLSTSKQARLRKVGARVTSGATLGDTLPATGAAWTQYAPVGELAIDAAAGDYLELMGSWLANPGDQSFYDIGIKVGGSIVYYASTGSATPSVEGDPSLYPADTFTPVGYYAPLDVAAEHIDSDGKVHFVLMIKTTNAAGKLYYSATYPFRWRVINYVGAAA